MDADFATDWPGLEDGYPGYPTKIKTTTLDKLVNLPVDLARLPGAKKAQKQKRHSLQGGLPPGKNMHADGQAGKSEQQPDNKTALQEQASDAQGPGQQQQQHSPSQPRKAKKQKADASTVSFLASSDNEQADKQQDGMQQKKVGLPHVAGGTPAPPGSTGATVDEPVRKKNKKEQAALSKKQQAAEPQVEGQQQQQQEQQQQQHQQRALLTPKATKAQTKAADSLSPGVLVPRPSTLSEGTNVRSPVASIGVADKLSTSRPSKPSSSKKPPEKQQQQQQQQQTVNGEGKGHMTANHEGEQERSGKGKKQKQQQQQQQQQLNGEEKEQMAAKHDGRREGIGKGRKRKQAEEQQQQQQQQGEAMNGEEKEQMAAKHDEKYEGIGKGKKRKQAEEQQQQQQIMRSKEGTVSSSKEKKKQQAPEAAKLGSGKAQTAGDLGKSNSAEGGGSGGAGGSLFDKMRARLSGGRFRSLNEQLYMCKGDEALRLMQSDPSLFAQYHGGFQQQTEAVEFLNAKPPNLVVADFGCGDGRLAPRVKQVGKRHTFDLVPLAQFVCRSWNASEKVPRPRVPEMLLQLLPSTMQETHSLGKTHSFDLVSSAPHVVACNMASVPLDSASVDVAVFSLALMGTDYGAFLTEAARVLRHKGWLWIAENRTGYTSHRERLPHNMKPAVERRSTSMDMAVFSLALMGTEYGTFLAEAARLLRHKGWLWVAEALMGTDFRDFLTEAVPKLRHKGWLWVAEVRSRFTQEPDEEKDVGKANSQHLQPFLKCLARLGFTLQHSKDEVSSWNCERLSVHGEAGWVPGSICVVVGEVSEWAG
ncbi:methyltransferase-domain-containing protein [Dunaliella salina]|uniref:Methyltransferase-domain-containing protein n=1 Tax=Dunaliella salina TaxID=3046 RepID=A0ABQ7GNT6_DUNSA|nr:methyltransferase-domain-containing protein [Dunaliella salina]|eukprot:KAF5836256.1 methyltransferase-domain-containing protein [Dunaliella salina]